MFICAHFAPRPPPPLPSHNPAVSRKHIQFFLIPSGNFPVQKIAALCRLTATVFPPPFSTTDADRAEKICVHFGEIGAGGGKSSLFRCARKSFIFSARRRKISRAWMRKNLDLTYVGSSWVDRGGEELLGKNWAG